MSQPQPGMMVTSSVRLERRLASGGMGSVWLAEHLGLKSQVVVKFIAEHAMDSDAVQRFSREAAAAAQVKSPHVVQTLDHGVTGDGHPYIVLEYLEGRDLDQQLKSEGALSPASVSVVLTQLSRALEKAHARGIVHRDIKPANVFLCDSGDGDVFVKLLDFGIAKGVDLASGMATRTGAAMGTPLYMSPEQLLGKKNIDHRADLWSLGVLAFEALTGSTPFDAETVGGLTVRIMNEPPPKVSAVKPELGTAFDAWFEHVCAREPADRFSSARETAEAFAIAAGVTAQPQVSIAPSGRASAREVDPLGDTREHRSTGNVAVLAASHPTQSNSRTLPVVAALVAALVAIAGIGTWLKLGRTGTASVPTTAAYGSTGLTDVGAPALTPSASVTPLTSAATPSASSLPPLASSAPIASAAAGAVKLPKGAGKGHDTPSSGGATPTPAVPTAGTTPSSKPNDIF